MLVVRRVPAAVHACTPKHGLSCFAGYMGTQAFRDPSGALTFKALFSIWDVVPTATSVRDGQAGWVPGAPGFCERFGGEGTGAHCIVSVTLQQGVVYAVRVANAGVTQVRARWGDAGEGEGDAEAVAPRPTPHFVCVAAAGRRRLWLCVGGHT